MAPKVLTVRTMDAHNSRCSGDARSADRALQAAKTSLPCDRVLRAISIIIAGVATVLLSACTSMGIDHPALRDSINYGPRENVRLCVLLDDGITPRDANALLDSWNAEAAIYNLYLEPVSFRRLPRAGFFHSEILDQVSQIPLGKSCDRVLYFVNRNLGDVVYGLASTAIGVPEILGEVDDATLTHGYVVARRATLNQLIMSPSGVTEHELFHLLGCPNHFDMPDCYARIHDLKLAEEQLKSAGYFRSHGERPFYPTFASRTDSMLVSRAQVADYQQLSDETGAAAMTGN